MQHQPAFVAQRQAFPAARLTDQHGVGAVLTGSKMGAPAAGHLFLGGAHAHEAGQLQRLVVQAGHRCHEGAERAFGVHAAAPVQHLMLVYTHRYLARHGVDVAQQHHSQRPAPAFAHRVAGRVDVGRETVCRHPVPQVVGHLGFLPRD